jgi:hypothetical protein
VRYTIAHDVLDACGWPCREVAGVVVDGRDDWREWLWHAAPWERHAPVRDVAGVEGLALGDMHLRALAANPPATRPPAPAAWCESVLADLVLFGDQSAGRLIVAALEPFPPAVVEAFVRNVAILAVGFESRAWIGGVGLPSARWPMVLSAGGDVRESVQHEATHAWLDRAPGGPPLGADPIALAHAWSAAYHAGARDPAHAADVDRIERRCRAFAAVWGRRA